MNLYAIISKRSGTLLRYEGTQADARAAARDLDAKWEPVEVATHKSGLIAHLNSLCGQLDGTPVAEPAPPPAPSPDVAARFEPWVDLAKEAKFERSLSVDEILERADYHEASSIQHRAVQRMVEIKANGN